jgi:hypothetical protein
MYISRYKDQMDLEEMNFGKRLYGLKVTSVELVMYSLVA